MTGESSKPTPQRQLIQLTARGPGGLIGFGGCRLVGLDGCWPWMLIGLGRTFAGAFLGQKFAGK